MASALDFLKLIDLSQKSLYISLAFIVFNPVWWNTVAQNEYRNKTITRILGGRPRLGCYFLAVAIFSMGCIRDYLFRRALQDQPHYSLFAEPLSMLVPAALILVGQTLVITSMWALGITGTFLGDYFGILMDARVEGFPFNILENPMYVGSTLCFAGGSLWVEKPGGLLITLFIYLVYHVALRFEGPFTTMIYASRSSTETKNDQTHIKKEL